MTCWFRSHTWQEVSRTFVDPVTSSWSLDQLATARVKALHMTGFTVILFQCARCNKFHHEELPGHVHQPKVVPLRKIEGGR